MIDEIGAALIASGGGGELAGKDGGSTWGTKDAGSVRVAEVDSSSGELVDVRGYGAGGLSETTDPIVHIVHRQQQDVGFLLGEIRLRIQMQETIRIIGLALKFRRSLPMLSHKQ